MEAKLCVRVIACRVKLVPKEEEPPLHLLHSVKDGPDLISASREPVNGQARDTVNVACGKVNKGVLVSWPLAARLKLRPCSCQ